MCIHIMCMHARVIIRIIIIILCHACVQIIILCVCMCASMIVCTGTYSHNEVQNLRRIAKITSIATCSNYRLKLVGTLHGPC